jgi:hypothetical protein
METRSAVAARHAILCLMPLGDPSYAISSNTG